MRFLLCLGIHPNVCPPHRPDKNAFVERFDRTYNQECLQLSRPQTLEQGREVTQAFMQNDDTQRPTQALCCGNGPPQVAFPELPHLPALAKCVDPDAWLSQVHGQHFIGKGHHNGSVRMAAASYSIHVPMSGQSVDLCVDAHQPVFVVWHQQQILKPMPIKGVHKTMLSFEQFAALMCQQALCDQRRLLQAQQATPAAGREARRSVLFHQRHRSRGRGAFSLLHA